MGWSSDLIETSRYRLNVSQQRLVLSFGDESEVSTDGR